MRGYTLIELLIVVGVIAVLSTIVIFRFSSVDQFAAVNNAASTITHDIRQVVTNAEQGRLLNSSAVLGYGIHFQYPDNNTHYILYANPIGVSAMQFTDGVSIIIADRDFIATESLPSIEITACDSTPCDLFLPTDQRTIFLGGTAATQDLKLNIQNKKTKEERVLVFDYRTSQVNAQ